jgi:hypothetical protein
VNRGQFMRFIDRRDIDLDEIDYVSAWLLRLAVGMMVLGAVFAVLDRVHLLPRLPAEATAAGTTPQQAVRAHG